MFYWSSMKSRIYSYQLVVTKSKQILAVKTASLFEKQNETGKKREEEFVFSVKVSKVFCSSTVQKKAASSQQDFSA